MLLDAFRPCLRRAWIPWAAAGRMHLLVTKLTPKGSSQMGLFDRSGEKADRAERVADVKPGVNGKHGRFALRSAATLPLVEVYSDPANGHDICDVRGKVCF